MIRPQNLFAPQFLAKIFFVEFADNPPSRATWKITRFLLPKNRADVDYFPAFFIRFALLSSSA
jgi:hypothetical protein